MSTPVTTSTTTKLNTFRIKVPKRKKRFYTKKKFGRTKSKEEEKPLPSLKEYVFFF